MEKSLVIVRGIPGCGKSTFAKIVADCICTADDYMMVDGMMENRHGGINEHDVSDEILQEMKNRFNIKLW